MTDDRPPTRGISYGDLWEALREIIRENRDRDIALAGISADLRALNDKFDRSQAIQLKIADRMETHALALVEATNRADLASSTSIENRQRIVSLESWREGIEPIAKLVDRDIKGITVTLAEAGEAGKLMRAELAAMREAFRSHEALPHLTRDEALTNGIIRKHYLDGEAGHRVFWGQLKSDLLRLPLTLFTLLIGGGGGLAIGFVLQHWLRL